MIKVISCEERVTATAKKISFIYEGEEFRATLYWDEHDGYELIFPYLQTQPAWAIGWEDNYPDEDSLYTVLDNLSDEVNA